MALKSYPLIGLHTSYGWWTRVISLVGIVLLLLIAFFGCQAPKEGEQGTRSAGATERTVEVNLTEFKIDMPATLPAGPTTFKVTNTGAAPHNFEIEGQGIEQELATNLTGGQTGTLKVDLKPGTYEIYCPVGDHKDKGMTTKLTVTQ